MEGTTNGATGNSGSGGATGAGGQPGTAGGGAAPGSGTQPPAGGAPPAPAAPWYGTNFQKESSRSLVETKKWKSYDDIADAYVKAEERLGAPPDQLLRLPNPKDTAGRKAFFKALGAPDDVKGYGIEIGEGADAKAVEAILTDALDAGLTAEQAKRVIGAFKRESGALEERSRAEYGEKHQARVQAIERKWGPAFQANEQVAGQAMAFLWGEPADTPEKQAVQDAFVEHLEKALGYDVLMERMYAIGKQLGEHKFIQDGAVADPMRVLSPEEAGKEQQRLMNNKDFTDRLERGEDEAVKRWDHLKKCRAAGRPDIRLG